MVHKYVSPNSLLPFFLSWQNSPNSSCYNLCFSFQFQEQEKAFLIAAKLQELVALKAFLRQTFCFEDEKLVASIHQHLPAEVNFLSTSAVNLPLLTKQLTKEPHDISTCSAVRLNIINLEGSDEYVALFNIHHILMDGVCLDQLITDLDHLLAGQQITKESAEEYISKVEKEKNLSSDTNDPNIINYRNQVNKALTEMSFGIADIEKNVHYSQVMPAAIVQHLTTMSRLSGLSLFNLLLIGQGVFFAKLFCKNVTIINYPVDIRSDKTLYGCYVNVVPYLLNFDDVDSFQTLVSSFHKNLPILKALTTLQATPQAEFLPSFGISNIAKPLSLTINEQPSPATSFSQMGHSLISLKYRELNNKLYFTLDIAEKFLPDYLRNSLLNRFFKFIEKLLQYPNKKLSQTSLAFLWEKKQILQQNNAYNYQFKNSTVHSMFEQQVQKKPEHLALTYQDQEITYAELNSKANRLANYLLTHHKIGSNEIVAICLDRSIHVIIAMLAILKAGGAYTSLGSKSFSERTNYILKNSRAKLIITNSSTSLKLKGFLDTDGPTLLVIDETQTVKEVDQQATCDPKVVVSGNNLAQLIYTSGTTGLPKGVMIEHNSIVSLIKNVDYITIKEYDTFALFSDLTFDASTFEIWGSLLNGAKLFIPHNKVELLFDAEQFKAIITKHQLTIILLTKTLFDQLYSLDDTLFSSLSYLLIGGESLNKTLINNLATSAHKPKFLINAYGPTENTTISCCYHIVSEKIKNLATVPIGTPITNRTAYVLDQHQNLMPIGAVGELYVGGIGLAKGYWHQEELTGKKFIINPFQLQQQKKYNENSQLYKTGDLARILPDGNIEYIGREDSQIKIRGYRVELEEIENKLNNHPKIKQIAVLENKTIDNAGKLENYLVAYYSSKKKINPIRLRTYLSNMLPSYMIPKAFIHLTEFPTTDSGKLDRKHLPPAEEFMSNDYVEPKNEKELLICQAFSKVLDIAQVSAKADFFDLGGNSLKAIELVAILKANIKISVSDIFNLRSPRKLAKDITYSKENLKEALTKVKKHFQAQEKQVSITKEIQGKVDQYLATIPQGTTKLTAKSVRNILLTGAKGYLGCNILRKLLNTTDYNVYLLIRADSHEKCFGQLNNKFEFYFSESLEPFLGSRIFVFPANLEKKDLGVTPDTYDLLINEIDSIIHAAAFTKHYGEPDRFYSANVQATINLLELSLQTKLKDFHHISSVSVLDTGKNPSNWFTEDDVLEDFSSQSNLYIYSKYQAERQVIDYRKKGVTTNIYRVGNLAFISSNYRVQENFEDNAFFIRLKCLLNLKVAVPEIGIEEISPVDYTASAIIKLFDKKELNNGIYHVFNPNLCNVADRLSELDFVEIKPVSVYRFLDMLCEYLDKPDKKNHLRIRFLLHLGWFEGEHHQSIISFILQDRTNAILKSLGFEWPVISREIFSKFIQKTYSHNI